MPPLGRLVVHMLHAGEFLQDHLVEIPLNRVAERRVVVLHGHHIIAAALDDLSGGLGLCVQGVHGHHGAPDIQHFQQFRHGRDLVALVVNPGAPGSQRKCRALSARGSSIDSMSSNRRAIRLVGCASMQDLGEETDFENREAFANKT
jgi:hypothetical protein